MKIAVFCAPWIQVPPTGYGGTERVASLVTEGLIKRGHDVTLYATGDSKTTARLEYFYEKALGNHVDLKTDPHAALFHIHNFFKIIKSEKFDIIHTLSQTLSQFFFDLQDQPFIHTLNGAFYQGLEGIGNFKDKKREALIRFKNHPYVSISNQQRTGCPDLNYIATVYNGIEGDHFKLASGDKKYLAWLGRITPTKGLDIAINIAKKSGMSLKVAGVVERGDKEYFDSKIKPLIGGEIEFIGEIKSDKEKSDFFNNAYATLFPIKWHEPFGIVMIESLACGVPVIAFNKGSVSEVMQDKKTGFVVDTEEQMLKALGELSSINRAYCRDYAIKNFSADKMVDDYVIAYKKVLSQRKN